LKLNYFNGVYFSNKVLMFAFEARVERKITRCTNDKQ